MRLRWIVLALLCVLFTSCADETQRGAKPAPATATPSQQKDSAPVSPLARATTITYRGETAYTGMPPVEVTFDPTVWHMVESADEPALVHTSIAPCVLLLRHGFGQAIYIGELDLGAWHWQVFHNGPRFPDELVYSVLLDTYAAGFRIKLPPAANATTRTACRDAAERVLATFSSTDPAVRPTAPDTLSSASPFSANDPAGWPLLDLDQFTIQHPPGWTHTDGDNTYWQFAGILPASQDGHYDVRGAVTIVRYANSDRLPLAEWLLRRPPSETELSVLDQRASEISGYPAISIDATIVLSGDRYHRTWLECGGQVWQLSASGGFDADVQAELQQIYRQMVDSFRCTPAP